MKSAYKLLIFTILTLLIGLSGLICGMIGDNWFRLNTPTKEVKFGLMRHCETSHSGFPKCTSRKLFSFSDKYIWPEEIPEIVLDQVFSLLMAASATSIISFALLMVMGVLFNDKKYKWKMMALLSFFFLGITAIISLSGTGISEHYIMPVISISYTQDWSSTLAWCGAACIVISATSSFLLIFMVPFDGDKITTNRGMSLAPVFTLAGDNTVLHTNEDLYEDLFGSYEVAALHMDFFTTIDSLPVPPSYAEASKNQGKPPTYTESISNPYAV